MKIQFVFFVMSQFVQLHQDKQSFSDGDECLGGATIDEVYRSGKKLDYLDKREASAD